MSIVHSQLSIHIRGRGGIGERWEHRRWRKERPERVAAVGGRRRRVVAEDIRRAPQQEDSVDLGDVTSVKVFQI